MKTTNNTTTTNTNTAIYNPEIRAIYEAEIKKLHDRIREYYEENESEWNEAIEALDAYNGYLEDGRYYSMDELDEFYHGTDPVEVLQRAFFGYDDDTEGSSFNPNRDYFRFNAYGNLVSSDYVDYSIYLDDYAIDEILENYNEIYYTPEEAPEYIQRCVAMINCLIDEMNAAE